MANATQTRRLAQAAAALLLGVGFAGVGGQANAAPLVTGNSLTVGPYTITVNSCSASCSGAEFDAIGGAGFIITGTGGGTLLNANADTGALDISAIFEVTTATPHTDSGSVASGGKCIGRRCCEDG